MAGIMSETVISIILLVNIILVLLYFMMKSHKNAIDKARDDYNEAVTEDAKEENTNER